MVRQEFPCACLSNWQLLFEVLSYDGVEHRQGKGNRPCGLYSMRRRIRETCQRVAAIGYRPSLLLDYLLVPTQSARTALHVGGGPGRTDESRQSRMAQGRFRARYVLLSPLPFAPTARGSSHLSILNASRHSLGCCKRTHSLSVLPSAVPTSRNRIRRDSETYRGYAIGGVGC